VSVAIPAYNAEKTIRETLDSVLEQSYPNIEVIVVDDGSTDGTWSVLQSYGSRIRSIHQENQGLAGCRNTGLRAAVGKYIALLDSDDLCEPERIAVQVELFERFESLVLCSSDFSGFDANGPLETSYCGVYYGQCSPSNGGARGRYPRHATLDIAGCLSDGRSELRVPVYYGNVYEELVHGNFVHPPTIMFHRHLLVDVGLFDPDRGLACDWDWTVRVSRSGEIGFVDRPMLRYRRSAAQVSSSPRNALDSLRAAQRMGERDPVLRKRDRGRFQEHIRALRLDAAYAYAPHHRWKALMLLIPNLGHYRAWNRSALRLLAKIALPGAVIEFLQQGVTMI
jgi:glycosyltransferase involved in cell wall biosynthesis